MSIRCIVTKIAMGTATTCKRVTVQAQAPALLTLSLDLDDAK